MWLYWQSVCLFILCCLVTGIGVLQGMMQELAEANGRQDYAAYQRTSEAKYFDCTGDFCCCDVLV